MPGIGGMSGMPGLRGPGAHAVLNILPEWLGVAWTLVFLAVAGSHLRHLLDTTGQRRPWHACHVLMAFGMAFMFAPAVLDPLSVPASFWRLVFACAGLLAATWAIGGVGRAATLIWLLTAVDLAVMLFMWSGSTTGSGASLSWLLVAYLVVEAMMWGFDAYRRIDRATPLVSWQSLAAGPGGGGAVLRGGAVTAEGAAAAEGSLLGELDISVSMIAMVLGMAYMLVALQLLA